MKGWQQLLAGITLAITEVIILGSCLFALMVEVLFGLGPRPAYAGMIAGTVVVLAIALSALRDRSWWLLLAQVPPALLVALGYLILSGVDWHRPPGAPFVW